MKKMQIFEGAVCASDGMCGLSVDQELMRIDTVVKVLQNNAYDIDRYIMPGDRKAFLENEVAGEFLPGQFDQRADSAAQCIQMLVGGDRPDVKYAKIYILSGNISDRKSVV